MLEFKNVKYSYPDGTRIFSDLSFKINEGEFVYIIGPTGTGKTTLTKLITSEIIPVSGSINFKDIDVGHLKKRKVPMYRRQIGVIYQEFYLLPKKTCLENVMFVLEMIDMKRLEARNRAKEVLKLVGLNDVMNKYPSEISGGEKQRLAIARAIAFKPKMLICDEPTANLDPDMSEEVMNIIEKINLETGTAIIFITHNSLLVNQRRKRTIVLEGGMVTADLKDGGYHSHNSFVESLPNKEPIIDEIVNSLDDNQKDLLIRKLLNK